MTMRKACPWSFSAVDAQNSFDAKIRSRSFCARSQEGDNWVTNEIVFEQR